MRCFGNLAMGLDIFHYLECCWTLISGRVTFKVIFTTVVAILVWKFLRLICAVATADSGIHYVATKRLCLKVISHYIPFTFNADYDTASYSGIKCRIKTEKPCYVQALWGVPMDKLCKFFSSETRILRNAISTSDLSQMFSKYCIDCHPSELIAANEEKVYEFKPKDDTETLLVDKTTSRREIYPFVFLMVVSEDEELHDTTAVAMLNVIHVPDRIFQHHPYLLHQFVKLSSGDIGEVKKIYRSSSAITDEDGQSDLCLVCYSNPVSMVYLPCRHACVCNDCIKLCKTCPVCRASSTCHFQLSNSE